jgi:hypothetical protein
MRTGERTEAKVNDAGLQLLPRQPDLLAGGGKG